MYQMLKRPKMRFIFGNTYTWGLELFRKERVLLTDRLPYMWFHLYVVVGDLLRPTDFHLYVVVAGRRSRPKISLMCTGLGGSEWISEVRITNCARSAGKNEVSTKISNFHLYVLRTYMYWSAMDCSPLLRT